MIEYRYGVREYIATTVRVVDGDTAHVQVDPGFDVRINMTVRFAGINAPEMSTDGGPRSKTAVEDAMPIGGQVVIRTLKDRREKYGRYLAWVMLPGGWSLNGVLVAYGLAEPYGDLAAEAPAVNAIRRAS